MLTWFIAINVWQRKSEFVPGKDKVYTMCLASVWVRPFSSGYFWSYRAWDCRRRVADLLTILWHKAQDLYLLNFPDLAWRGGEAVRNCRKAGQL